METKTLIEILTEKKENYRFYSEHLEDPFAQGAVQALEYVIKILEE